MHAPFTLFLVGEIKPYISVSEDYQFLKYAGRPYSQHYLLYCEQ